MVINLPPWFFDDSVPSSKQESLILILIKTFGVCLLGTFCLTAYSPVVNLAAFALIILAFLNTLVKRDHFSLLIQLFFANHYVFGNDKGGVFNIAALIALCIYGLSGPVFKTSSSFPRMFGGLFFVLLAFQLLSVTANMHAGLVAKFGGLMGFLGISALIYQFSKVSIQKSDFIRFIHVLFFFTAFELIVSLNQKYGFIGLQTPFLPVESGVEYELDIFRCMGTFINFEAYAEYSLSVIALLLPGILSGSFRNISKKFYYMTVGIVIMSFMAMILTVTRSSLFMLPFVMLFILMSQYKRVKLKAVLPFVLILFVGIAINSRVKIFDISSFIERSQEMKIKNLSDVTSGNEINRGGLFAYAFEKIQRSKGLIGAGYFTNPDDYNTVHFDTPKPEIGDYHNLYLSITVFWGIPGAVAFVLIFLMSIYHGIRARRTANISPFDADLLLGFNTLFIFFLVNQYKIIFLRESNYTVVILLLLVMYRGLIRKVTSPDLKVIIN
ncbi:O-antigen ligase family protein [Mucilaginibacter sp. Bleaf8]|uniref:O-antigen ligase family protein n=1 Tax=Mucilaginibacter sp. Bleaf8 TaxID=2834430 RepID=UPI001BCEFB8F|nr:O-antigen ligase family protein [Mucilaginibacter sp. Bleaf8]MBS7566819.1 O-antigen ligase family protein [Mucilaginibacter sp. Bleaf8]